MVTKKKLLGGKHPTTLLKCSKTDVSLILRLRRLLAVSPWKKRVQHRTYLPT